MCYFSQRLISVVYSHCSEQKEQLSKFTSSWCKMFSFFMKLHLFTFVSGIISMFTFIFPPSLNQTFFSDYSPLNIDTMAPCGGQASWSKITILWHQTVQGNKTRREKPLLPGSGPISQGGLWEVGPYQVVNRRALNM